MVYMPPFLSVLPDPHHLLHANTLPNTNTNTTAPLSLDPSSTSGLILLESVVPAEAGVAMAMDEDEDEGAPHTSGPVLPAVSAMTLSRPLGPGGQTEHEI